MAITAFDYETTGFNPRKNKVFTFVLTDEELNSVVYDLSSPGSYKVLEQFMADPTIEKIAHNLKFELHFTLRQMGIVPHPDTIWHDTMIMSQIANNLEQSHALDYLAGLYCPDKDLVKEWKRIDHLVSVYATEAGRYDRVPKKLMHKYQINDGTRTMLLFHTLLPQVRPYWTNYRSEMDLVECTQEMEDFGMNISVPAVKQLLDEIQTEVEALEPKLFAIGKSFENYNSDDVLRDLLYVKKGYPVSRKTKSGEPSVDKEVFYELREAYPQDKEMLDTILKYKVNLAGISTLNGYLDKIDPTDGLVHHNINTNGARTGRQSASNPNMQNVAKQEALKNLFTVPCRKVFTPREGALLAFVDYAGIEMRLIIEAVKEPTMIEVLKSGGGDPLDPKKDIHALASSYWFGKMFTDIDYCLNRFLPTQEGIFKEFKKVARELDPKSEEYQALRIATFNRCRKVMRSGGKNAQFALAYGADIKKILMVLGMPEHLIRPGYEAYRKRFPLIASFTKDSMHLAKRDGFVTTSFGRRLMISKDKIHTASNYRIQGTASEMLKRSTVLLRNYLKAHFPDIRIIVPIHDELMLHVPKTYIPTLGEMLPLFGEEMTRFPELAVPIEVEWEFSELSWNDKTSLEKMLKRMEKTNG